MVDSIEQISQRAGIKGTSGSFDFEADAKQERMMEDTRHLTAGGEGAAGPDPRIAANAKRQKALHETIFNDEASANDRSRGEMSAYFEQKTGTYNIGPGLNLDSTIVQKALKVRDIDAEELKGAFDYSSKETIPSELQEVMKGVFTEVVAGATKEVKQLIGFGNWKHLKPHEQDALTEMSYNLGKTKLSGFKNMLAAVSLLISKRKGAEGFSDEATILKVIKDEMADSKWAKEDVKERAIRIQQRFTGGKDEDTQRFLKWKHGK